MKFNVTKTSGWLSEESDLVEIETLEQLLEFVKKSDNDVIIKLRGDELELEIYDDYRE